MRAPFWFHKLYLYWNGLIRALFSFLFILIMRAKVPAFEILRKIHQYFSWFVCLIDAVSMFSVLLQIMWADSPENVTHSRLICSTSSTFMKTFRGLGYFSMRFYPSLLNALFIWSIVEHFLAETTSIQNRLIVDMTFLTHSLRYIRLLCIAAEMFTLKCAKIGQTVWYNLYFP